MRSNTISKQRKVYGYSMFSDNWTDQISQLNTRPQTLFAKCHAGWPILVRLGNGMTNDGYLSEPHNSRLWHSKLDRSCGSTAPNQNAQKGMPRNYLFLPNFGKTATRYKIPSGRGETGATFFLRRRRKNGMA